VSDYSFSALPKPLEPHPYRAYINGFTSEELDWIIRHGDSLLIEKAGIGSQPLDSDYSTVRITETGWIAKNEETDWLYERLGMIAQQFNKEFYNFDLYGFVEDFQYTVYRGEQKSHYDWHVDQGGDTPAPRKLSMSVQLSDPFEYTGGDLLVKVCGDDLEVPKGRGTIIAFPSYNLHRVTPLTSGIRKSLVVWVAGPPFR
jgi:PKHD-type hydroxylase